MKCAEFEQLIDPHLDGELSGSLRLEFDAHRLGCRRCQLTVAMMESVGHLITCDRPTSALADDFTERVMTTIERRSPLAIRLRSTRVAVVAGALLQAAAVIYLAVVLPSKPAPRPQPRDSSDSAAALKEMDIKVDQQEALYDYIVSQVDALRTNVASECNQLARYPLTLAVSDEFARESVGSDQSNPWRMFMGALVPIESEEAESSTPASTNQHSL